MFTCLEILPEKEGIFSKIYEKIKPPLPQREYVQVKGGTPFLRLKVRENHMSWSKISASLEKNERHVIAASDTQFPDCVSLTRAEPRSLGTNIMFRTALKLLEESGKGKNLSFSIYDRDGSCIKMLKSLAPLVRYVSVYTEKIREYFYAASVIMEEWGMSVKINEYESLSPPGEIIVADEFSLNMKNAELVFLSSPSVISYNTVTGEGFALDEPYRILKSRSTDDFLFASALYEYNGVRIFENCEFSYLCLAGRRVSREILLEKFG